jgi:CHAD domain-containing protein
MMTGPVLMLPHNTEVSVSEKAGLAFWMGQVVEQYDRVAANFAPEPVHDLRVALRRCRSIAGGLRSFDPSPGWEQMRKEGGRLFKQLGELRDTQVMIGRMMSPDAPQDEAARMLLEHLCSREADLRERAAAALSSFDRKKWVARTARLSKRAALIPLNGGAFLHLAQERWHEAYWLHRQALRNRSHIGFHRLRIGLKKFRYTVENFLPTLYDEWDHDLRSLQDLLGEMNDLHVLHGTAIEIHAVQDRPTRRLWRSWIEGETSHRLDCYRRIMIGRDSLWRRWRALLPQGEQLKSAAMERLETWAFFRDPDCRRSRRVAQLALQLYEGLASQNLPGMTGTEEKSRAILRAAALLHAVEAPGGKKIRKEPHRIVARLQPLLGWEKEDFRVITCVVHYHRGALPAPGKPDLLSLTEDRRRLATILSGILRLAVAFAASRQAAQMHLQIDKSGEILVIRATGYDKYTRLAQKLARARHHLEVTCGLPVVIRNP